MFPSSVTVPTLPFDSVKTDRQTDRQTDTHTHLPLLVLGGPPEIPDV